MHGDYYEDGQRIPGTPASTSSRQTPFPFDASGGSVRSMNSPSAGTRLTATVAPEGGEVSLEEASRWAGKNSIPLAVEVSALSGEGVEELFNRLARIILTKIELGEIDPDDPQSGIQYGDMFGMTPSDGGSIRSGITVDDSYVQLRKGKGRNRANKSSTMREWEDVFRIGGATRRKGCC